MANDFKPLLGRDLVELLERASEDAQVRAELILFVLSDSAEEAPEFDELHDFVSGLPDAQVGRELSAVLAGQPEADRLELLASAANLLPDALVPAMETMELDARKALLRRLVDVVKTGSDEAGLYEQLVDALRESKYADAVAELPVANEAYEDEDDTIDGDAELEELLAIAERVMAVEPVTPDEQQRLQQFLTRLGLTPEAFLAQDPEEPTSDE